MSSPPFDCLVAGEANVDLLVEGVTELELGKEKLARRMDLVLGGSSSITAFNLARLGARVAFCGLIGNDSFGDFVEACLRVAGVDVSGLRRTAGEKTGLTIWHTQAGQRAGVTYPGTIALLRAEEVTGMERARHLHVGAYFLLRAFQTGAAALFERARGMGMTTSLDCNYDPEELWDGGIRQVLRHTDFFFPNEEEARKLTGLDSVFDAAGRLGEWGHTVAVKCGDRGALLCERGVLTEVPAQSVRVVDTTGAGDSFNAGFLAAYLRGASVRESAKAGVAAGARCVEHVGGTGAFQAG